MRIIKCKYSKGRKITESPVFMEIFRLSALNRRIKNWSRNGIDIMRANNLLIDVLGFLRKI